MPRDTVFSTSSDDLERGWPLTVYVPDDYGLAEVNQVNLRDGYPTYLGVTPEGSETIRAADGFPLERVRGQRGLGVHWTRDGGFVQLGPTARAEDGTDVPVPGHWVDLDWSQCNRLIRFLRNARDQAFGRPE